MTLATRDDLAPRARELLAQQFTECCAELGRLLQDALDDLERELFGIARQSAGGQAQNEALESLREVQRARGGFHTCLIALLAQRFARIGALEPDGARRATPSTAHLDLSLVEPEEYEDRIALADLSSRIETRAGNALFELGHRYAVLIGRPPLDNESLPPGPHALATALGEATQPLGMHGGHCRLFYRLCDRRLCAAADSLYARLSEHLKAAGILPHLRSYLPRRTSGGPRDDEVQPPESTPSPATGPVTNFSPPLHHAPAAPLPDMSNLHGLLDTRRRALPPVPVDARARRGEAVSLAELESALTALQSQPAHPATPRDGDRLRSALLAQLQHASATGRGRELEPGHRDAVDLVGLLYDQLLAATCPEGATQQLLATLQVPLLRVALSDSDFFTVRNHPARRLLNLLLETAHLWLDLTDGNPDTTLNQRLQRSVERVARDRNHDPGLFASEADDLEAYIQQRKRRAEIVERRHVEAARGRERLLTAQANARTAVAGRLAKHEATPLARALLERAWTDALTLTALRDGENSEAYRRRLSAVDALLGPPTARDDSRLAMDLQRGLTEVGLPAEEAEQVTHQALGLPVRTPERGAPVSQTALLIHLKSRHKPGEDAGHAPAEPQKLPPLTHAARRALEGLKTLPFGTWLEFTVNQQGQRVARKLAWYAPLSGRCLLVNVRGAVAPQRTLEQVARLMALGQARLPPRRDDSMLDRAWGALTARLRKFSHSPYAPETAT